MDGRWDASGAEVGLGDSLWFTIVMLLVYSPLSGENIGVLDRVRV